ncbi:hypothetical protein NCC49_002707 [Naganishia albida]|nr:hypothetical protein NCC49_002707 [Naganishia albida]
MSDASIPEQFTGYASFEPQGDTFTLKKHTYTPRPFEDDDIDIKIHACGICGSDIHTLRSGWGPSKYPAIVGHEIVGTVCRAGKNSGHQVGDLVGVGAQCNSCRQCDACKTDNENYCKKAWCATYQGALKDGQYTQGGYADYYRSPGHFAVKIPEGMDEKVAAPLLCAGVTVFSPLHHYGCGPGKRVGVIGIGGLGHLGIQFAKALGAETFALSTSKSKEEDCKKMGADGVLVTKDPKALLAEYAGTFDLLLGTSFAPDMPFDTLYMPLLKPRGHILQVGLPEERLPGIQPSAILGKSITGSLIGSPAEIKKMFEIAVKHDIKPWIQERPMSDAQAAVQDMHEGKARYRYVLVNDQ